MIFLGYNFFSDTNSFAPTPSGHIINAIRIFDGEYNSLFVSANPDLTLGNIGDAWDYDTRIKTNFENNTLEAGNSSFSLVNTEQLLIKRRVLGEQKWVVIYIKDVETTDDFKFYFIDKYARSGIEYEYAICSVSGGIENSFVVDNVYSEFQGMYITDKDCLYGTIFNVDCSTTTQNLINSTLSLLNSKYMTVVSNGQTCSESGTASGTFLKFDDNDVNKYNRQRSFQYRAEIKNRLANKKPLILKVEDGRIWMIRVTGQPTDSSNGHLDLRSLSFDWAEIGDYNDMETLYRNGFSDVDDGWW